MKIIGLLIYAAFSGLIALDHARSEEARLREYSAISRLLSHIEAACRIAPSTLAEAARTFDGEGLPKGLAEYLGANRKRELSGISFLVDSEDKDALIHYFSNYGEGTAEAEKRRLSEIIVAFEKKLSRVKEEMHSKRRVAVVLYATFLVSAILLVM